MDAYFDNSATTEVKKEVADDILNALTERWGNPSAANGKGLDAYRLLGESRDTVLSSVCGSNDRKFRAIFTGSGTEADNLAISGTIYSKNFRYRPKIVTTDSEHPAVLRTVEEAEKRGFEVVKLSTKKGVIDLNEVEDVLDERTVLVSVMRVNNETGAIYPIKKISEIARRKSSDAVIHCDAVQGYMKVDCSPKATGADLISVSGHKIGGPKGIGALICDNTLITKKRILPIIYGGGQEDGYRSGTENMPGIVGMASAVKHYKKGSVTEIREKILSSLGDGFIPNIPEGEYLPNIISLYCEGMKSEVVVRYLAEMGIHISAGSACSTKKLKTSHALLAFGLTPNVADSTVRISIGDSNTLDEAEYLVAGLESAKKTLSRKSK